MIEDIRLKHSCFVKTFFHKGTYALYHSLKMNVVYVDGILIDIYKGISSYDTLEYLYQAFPLVKKSIIKSFISYLLKERYIDRFDNDLVTKHLFTVDTKVDISIMYLIITEACNLGCKYCYVKNSSSKNSQKKMSIKTMEKSIDLFKELSSDNRRIIFYGGEPFLNREILKKGVLYARSIFGEDVEIAINTNATMITEEDVLFIKEHNLQLSISIDGNEKVTNSSRPLNNGVGTYKLIENSIGLLHDANIDNVNISITITKENCDNLKENTRYLVEKYNIRSFGFNFLLDYPTETNPMSVDIIKATDSLLDTYKYLRENRIYEDRISRKLIPFASRKVYLKDCGAFGNQIVVTPDGKIGPCQGFLYNRDFFDNDIILKKDVVESENFKEWSKRFPLNMEVCKHCEAIAICGGGCAYQAKIKEGSIWNLDERMCKHNKRLIEWFIWEMYEKEREKKGYNNGS